jgi:hypothetical protein
MMQRVNPKELLKFAKYIYSGAVYYSKVIDDEKYENLYDDDLDFIKEFVSIFYGQSKTVRRKGRLDKADKKREERITYDFIEELSKIYLDFKFDIPINEIHKMIKKHAKEYQKKIPVKINVNELLIEKKDLDTKQSRIEHQGGPKKAAIAYAKSSSKYFTEYKYNKMKKAIKNNSFLSTFDFNSPLFIRPHNDNLYDEELKKELIKDLEAFILSLK